MGSRVRLALIWAQSENGVIGRSGRLPWRLPKEMAHFRRVTLGKPVIMGRRTFESLDGPLPQRTNIVLTRRGDFDAPGVKTVRSLSEALAIAESVAFDAVDEAVVIGGADVYAQALPIADRLYITLVHAEFEGDTFIPSFETSEWALKRSECVAADDANSHAFSLQLFERR
jgi:dihydrofolate reductase